MAIPVIAGLPWLAGVLGGVFSSIFTWFAQFLTKRLAIVAAAVAVLISITSIFMALVYALAQGLSVALPADIATAAYLVIPSNTPSCISAYLTAVVAKWAYSWNVRVIQYKLF